MNRASTSPRCPVCRYELREEALRPAPEGTLRCPRASCGVELLPGAPGQLQVRTFRLVNHFSLCVLPFAFGDQSPAEVFDRLDKSGRWLPRTFSPDNPEDVDRTEYFLPYARRFLFPNLYAAPASSAGKRTPRVPTCQHYQLDLTCLGSAGPDRVPFTLRARDSRREFTFDSRLTLEQAGLIVFSYRVGFLVLRCRSAEPAATYFDQMSALTFLRLIAPLHQGFEMPELLAGEARYRMPQLLAYLLAEFDARTVPPQTPAEVPAGAPLPVKPIYDDRMVVYTFSCLDKDTCLADLPRCQDLLERTTVVNLEPDREPVRVRPPDDGDPRRWLRRR